MKNSKKSRVSIYSLYGASIGIVIATTILISSYIYSIHFDTPDPEAWVYVTSF